MPIGATALRVLCAQPPIYSSFISTQTVNVRDMTTRSRSRSRSAHVSRGTRSHSSTTTVFSKDHDRYNEEWEVYDAITRAVKAYNHDIVDSNIQLGTLEDASKNKLYVVIPFTTTQVKSFTTLAADISTAVHAEVDISADIDIDNDAQIHFSFNVLRSSFKERGDSPGMLDRARSVMFNSRALQLVVLLLILYYVFWW